MQARVAERAAPSLTSQGVRDRTATVVCGTRSITDTYVGKSVAWVRTELAESLGIPEGAIAILNGQPVSGGQEQITLLGPGSLEFVQRTGTKG